MPNRSLSSEEEVGALYTDAALGAKAAAKRLSGKKKWRTRVRHQ